MSSEPVIGVHPEAGVPNRLRLAADRYNRVRDALIDRAPRAWDEVVTVCALVPAQITADTFWHFGKDKPCWSNIKVAIGERIAADLARSPDFATHHPIASPAWDIRMLAAGPAWKKRTNFQMVGPAASQFVASLAPGGFRSYPWRLFAIRQFAQALTGGPGLQSIRALIDNHFDFGPAGIYAWARDFARLAGRGWGATTVQHMLTDLGLGVKPDLHLRRSAVRMGLLAPEVPSDLPDAEITARAPALDPLVVEALVAMAPHVRPTAHPGSTSALREIDKVLMEWSRQGLAQPLPAPPARAPRVKVNPR